MTTRRRHQTGCRDCGDLSAELWGTTTEGGKVLEGRCCQCEKAHRAGTTDTLDETLRRYQAAKLAHTVAVNRTDDARGVEKKAFARRLLAERDLLENFLDWPEYQ